MGLNSQDLAEARLDASVESGQRAGGSEHEVAKVCSTVRMVGATLKPLGASRCSGLLLGGAAGHVVGGRPGGRQSEQERHGSEKAP